MEGNVIAAEENVPAADETANDSLKYHLYNKDIQGSTTSILNESGAGELSYEYDDFGETEINGSGTFGNEICYTGGIYDASTGLYYLNARYYDPENGRFLTEDTYRGELKEPDTLHLYAYCKNNPINYVDPSGHWQLALAGAEYGYIVGSGAMAVGTGTVIVVGGVIFIVTTIVIVGVHYYGQKGIKVRLKESKSKAKSKAKSKTKGKTKSKSKSENNRATSKKVWQRGKTERIEVENYGNGRGNIHYHESNNTKWYYNIARKWFEYSNGRKAPSRIQKCLQDPVIKKAIQKAVKYLDK